MAADFAAFGRSLKATMKNTLAGSKEGAAQSRWQRAMRQLVGAIVIATPAFAVAPASAQSYPVKPIRIILPFAGGTDLVGRMLAGKLSPALGQQVVPDPRVGATGNIGYVAAAKSPPDGYTLLMGAVPVLTNPHLNPKVGFDPLRDFAPIALLATIPNVVVVHPSVPAKTLRELITLARGHPGKIAYGSGGVGSANHLAAEFLQSLGKIRFVHVPYKSATFGIAGAMSGEVDMVILVASSAISYVQAGKMRALVVLDVKRIDSMPDVPTSAESGMPQLVAVNWYVLLAPAGTPHSIIERLNAESVKAMSAPDTRERLHAMGGEPNPGTPEQTAAFLRAEYARWGKVIRDAGIKAE
jgi:tripartite-type tricarboxylate transporter receptor subunit TctC